MRKSIVIISAVISFVVLAGCGSSGSSVTTMNQDDADRMGAELVNGYWNALTCGGSDTVTFEDRLAPGFQSVSITGPKMKDQVLQLIGSTCYSSVGVRDIVTTAAPNTLVVSYQARSTANGVDIPWAVYTNVFVKDGSNWYGVVAANSGKVP